MVEEGRGKVNVNFLDAGFAGAVRHVRVCRKKRPKERGVDGAMRPVPWFHHGLKFPTPPVGGVQAVEGVSKYPFTHKNKVPILCFQALLLHGNFVPL